MYTLGINAAFHDSSACIIESGRLIAAAEEERLKMAVAYSFDPYLLLGDCKGNLKY